MKSIILVLSLVFYFEKGLCGDVSILYSSNLIFSPASQLYSSELDDVLAASLGYTTKSSSWNGLSIKSIFKHPLAAVLFIVKRGGVPIKMSETSYELVEDTSMSDVYQSFATSLGDRSQRPLHFKRVLSQDLKTDKSANLKEFKNGSEEDENFLQQISALSSIIKDIEMESSLKHGGQDVIFVHLDTFAPLAKKFGAESGHTQEASDILKEELERLVLGIRKFYADRVLILSAFLDQEIRTKRSIIGPADEKQKQADLKLADTYDEDFPVIFNICLVLSIVLIVAIITTSVSMAFMDPGRDSIIYRMTNPRMKKDQ